MLGAAIGHLVSNTASVWDNWAGLMNARGLNWIVDIVCELLGMDH